MERMRRYSTIRIQNFKMQLHTWQGLMIKKSMKNWLWIGHNVMPWRKIEGGKEEKKKEFSTFNLLCLFHGSSSRWHFWNINRIWDGRNYLMKRNYIYAPTFVDSKITSVIAFPFNSFHHVFTDKNIIFCATVFMHSGINFKWAYTFWKYAKICIFSMGC